MCGSSGFSLFRSAVHRLWSLLWVQQTWLHPPGLRRRCASVPGCREAPPLQPCPWSCLSLRPTRREPWGPAWSPRTTASMCRSALSVAFVHLSPLWHLVKVRADDSTAVESITWLKELKDVRLLSPYGGFISVSMKATNGHNNKLHLCSHYTVWMRKLIEKNVYYPQIIANRSNIKEGS